MKIGINHQVLPNVQPDFYSKYWDSIKTWAQCIRVDTHMDAYAWRVDPNVTYSDGFSPKVVFRDLALRAKEANISIDLIRDGFPSSPDWRAMGGDWSSFDAPNTWREWQLPKEVWSATNKWITTMAKTMADTKVSIRWQGSNEQFYRGKDQWAYERLKNIYSQATYSKPWLGPTIWGPRPQLIQSLDEWLVWKKFDKAFAKPSIVSVNVYPDWTPGVTIDTASNLKRQVENLILVSDWAVKNNQTLTISEFGFAENQVPEGEAKRAEVTAFVFKCMEFLPKIERAFLYWSESQYTFSNETLASMGSLIQNTSAQAAQNYINSLRTNSVESPL